MKRRLLSETFKWTMFAAAQFQTKGNSSSLCILEYLTPLLLLECGEVAWDIEEFSKSIEELSEIVSTLENSLPLTIKTFLCF
jgi:hypothetical protein